MEGWQMVKFIEENDMVEAVPAFWIFEESGGYKCRWPDTISGAKVRAAIRAKENWKSIPVEILSSSPYDNFYVATKKAGMAWYTSELEVVSAYSFHSL
ncbi:hypothetical protein JTB14_010580 [Gonioctena quinquepunctata]|nr:hypothetical protein JTB14_010580 [Gonioctena quinquepunctata]